MANASTKTVSPARHALEELLEKHAVPREKEGERRWEADYWQSNDGVHIGSAGFIASRSPVRWIRATVQGAAGREATERALLGCLKLLVGAAP